MRYIGPFFRMNNLSPQEISSQLFYFSKESLKMLSLESKCGIASSVKNYKKNNSIIDITTISNFSPLLCIYKKASPNLVHSKNYTSLDDNTFKKEICPKTNALMTLCILELIDYYAKFKDIDKKNFSICEIYKQLSREQLSFYSNHLRNTEGYFVSKKNTSGNSYKNFTLIDKYKSIDLTDQAYMMLCYYTYATKLDDCNLADDYKGFSLEILQMFRDYNSKLYSCSFKDMCSILFALNCLYSISKNIDCQELLIDLSDFIICKFDEDDYFIDDFDYTCLLSINLLLSYKNTNIISFFDKHKEIQEKLISIYDKDKDLFYKLDGKKTSKYSCLDIIFYIIALIYPLDDNYSCDDKRTFSSIYKKYVINSGIVSSWPEAPTLDDHERYKNLSLNSKDMLDESVFRMSNLASPNTSGIIPMLYKKVSYDKKKNEFSIGTKSSFDSQNNMIILFIILHLFKDNMFEILNFNSSSVLDDTSINRDLESNDKALEDSSENED